MILRKPYAFLIKYFKLIHIIMFISFSYLVFVLRKIYVFFANYIDTSNFTYFENMTNDYVPSFLFIIVIVLLALAIGILFLMRKKEKPILFYRIMIGYTILLLGTLIYFFTFFKSLDTVTYEPLQVVISRDIILFVYICNYFFVIFSFIRGFGFDIKKFSFERDMKELRLDETDSEEYELNLNIEKDDIKSFINKNKREFSYYLKENKTFFIIVFVIIILVVALYVSYTILVVNKVYKQGDNVSVGNITYRVNSSIISNVDKYGQTISLTDDYIIIDMTITNNEATGHLDGQAFRLLINDKYYYPNIPSCDMFSDLGICYKNQELTVNTTNNYIIVYKIDKNYNDIFLEILNNAGDYNYSKVKLSYVKSEAIDQDYNENDGIDINNQKIVISNYKIADKASYEYQECINDKCNNYTKRVLPYTGEVVLSFEIDSLSELSDDFINSSIGIKYQNKVYSGKDIRLITRHDKTLYFSVPGFLLNTKEFTLMVTTRSIRYNILVKGE